MTLRVIAGIKNDAVQQAIDRVDQGTTNAGGKVEIYTGAPPAGITDAPGETLLAEFTLDDPAFGTPTNGIADAGGMPKTDPGKADGDMGWARVLDRDENPLWDEDDVSTSGESAITVNTVVVSTGVDVELQSYKFFIADDT